MNQDYETSPVEDSVDQAILMHRDAHFSGHFDEMIHYYESAGKGIDPNFDIERIKYLANEEKLTKQNLAPQLLNAREVDDVKRSKTAYKALRDLYEEKKPKSPLPTLIANLILSEDENPEKEIAAILEQKQAIVPLLLDLLKSEDFHNPLFPGYGKAPFLAAKCLGEIGDKRAIVMLFESIGRGDFFDDEISLQALKQIGKPAEEFLLKVVGKEPINEDNEKAAIALLHFKDDPEVAEKAFNFLKTLNLKKEPSLATYLILICEGLKDMTHRVGFEIFSQRPDLSHELKNDCQAVIKLWN